MPLVPKAPVKVWCGHLTGKEFNLYLSNSIRPIQLLST